MKRLLPAWSGRRVGTLVSREPGGPCLSHLFPQVPAAAGEWADSGVYSGPVLQRQAQTGSALPPPPVFTSWTGAETHLPSLGGKSLHFTLDWG